MAILGQDGHLTLKRDTPAPLAVPSTATVKGDNSISVINQDWWTGDEVNLYSPFGIPTDAAQVPDGAAMYVGGVFDVGANRDHITSDADTFYAADADDFYLKGQLVTCFKAFIHRDEMDRISFYPNKRQAFNGRPADRYPWLSLDYRYVIISASAVIDSAKLETDLTALPGISTAEIRLPQACTNSSTFAPVDGFPWLCQADLREWSLELDAPSVDTTCVGAKFGNAVKSLVNGGGQCDFMVDRKYYDAAQDGTMLMRLLMLTEKGAKASAKFYLVKDRGGDICSDAQPGSMYYEAEILITNMAINVRIDEVVAGTARWVTTGEIRLKMGG